MDLGSEGVEWRYIVFTLHPGPLAVLALFANTKRVMMKEASTLVHDTTGRQYARTRPEVVVHKTKTRDPPMQHNHLISPQSSWSRPFL